MVKGRVVRQAIFHGTLTVAAVLLAMPAQGAEKSIGLTSFETIVLNGDFAVEVVNAAPLRAVISGAPDAIDRVELRSAGGVLTITDKRFGSNRTRGQGAGAVVIRISAAKLRSASVTGAGSLAIDRLTGAKVELAVRGPGALSVAAITADRLTLSSIGNGKITLAGTVKSAEAMVSGAGVVDAAKLRVTDLIATGEGAADQRFQATRTAQVTLRGIGRIEVDGTAKCTPRNLGTGTLICGQP
jgi:Putative auto-transporter adhesin, head GIN domain